jgi:hypothetical protein
MPAYLLGGFAFYTLHGTLRTTPTQIAPSMRGTAVSAFVACLLLRQSLGVFGASMMFDSRFPTRLRLHATAQGLTQAKQSRNNNKISVL